VNIVRRPVTLGRQAATQVEQQLPMLRDDEVTSYVAAIGHRLVEAIPLQLRHPEFRYAFQVVNVREINAFALPGGPMYLNRGMIAAAHAEAEMAGVVAHELSHVALRHGTARATKATKYELGALLGAVVGSIIGGPAGSVVSQGTQFGLGTAFLRFSREDEKQADLLGSHIMAAAGYDPRAMASMFKTIEMEGGSGGPQWLSDHPNPGARSEYITREAQLLDVRNPVRDTRAFAQTQARLGRMAPAPTTEAATRNAAARRGSTPAPEERPPTGRSATRSCASIRARPRSQKWPIASGGGVVRHMVAAPNGQRRGADFFVQIAGESFLIDDRRQCFLARGLEFTRDRFADRAVKLACSAVMRQELQFGRVVPERGADLLCIALGMAITSYAELAAEGIEEAAHAVLFASDRKASAVRVEVGLAVFDQRDLVLCGMEKCSVCTHLQLCLIAAYEHERRSDRADDEHAACDVDPSGRMFETFPE